jgi:hypothetical protein
MSRIAPLEPPYAPELKQQFDHIMRGAPRLRFADRQPVPPPKFSATLLIAARSLRLRS